MAIHRCCRRQQSLHKEMCHEEIHRCSRADLADCDPDAHPDCKPSSRVAVELLIWEQRVLRISRASERFLFAARRICFVSWPSHPCATSLSYHASHRRWLQKTPSAVSSRSVSGPET